MKVNFALFLILVSPFIEGKGLNIDRERIFHCMNFGNYERVEELFIVESKLGRNEFFEVEVPYIFNGEEETFYKKLNLIEKYQGRVLLFTTGNYRVKIDRVFPDNGKYKSFVRLPNFEVHSLDWYCKDY